MEKLLFNYFVSNECGLNQSCIISKTTRVILCNAYVYSLSFSYVLYLFIRPCTNLKEREREKKKRKQRRLVQRERKKLIQFYLFKKKQSNSVIIVWQKKQSKSPFDLLYLIVELT